ncbi:helix-turn-helix domain-containing protein [Sphingobium sp. H39-3-25]|uniref:helix-turn-helix domain-containing protein n=1 Tax=Sphingobium arseniciresistens TaxID=3030834 RepID=UPI0023B8ADED|nr:helix-turn-helix domain-containing protein [Sphingobium arseniciresistens]
MQESNETGAEQGVLNIDQPGDTLRRAREDQGLALQEVATRTRVPVRQLEMIERNDFAGLPGLPYAVGFARAYARAIGIDEVAIAAGVREALGGTDMQAGRYEAFEPADPARVPPRYLAWTALAIALILAAGFGVWRTQLFTPPTDEQIAAAQQAPAVAARPAAGQPARPAPAEGPVVLTALDAVWLRIYDQTGERLLEKEMAKGESYTVPADANNPMILTGRPDTLAVTVGGRPVPPLGPPERTISDMPISAAALLARAAPVPAPGSEAVAPAAGATARPAAGARRPAASAAPVAPASAGTAGQATGPAPATPASPQD